MDYQRLTVTKRVSNWGAVYRIGGAPADGDILSAEEADDLIRRFSFEQSLLASSAIDTIELKPHLVMPSLACLVNVVSL